MRPRKPDDKETIDTGQKWIIWRVLYIITEEEEEDETTIEEKIANGNE